MDVALQAAVSALAGPDRVLGADDLEVAVLERDNGRRAFRRIDRVELAELLEPKPPTRRPSRRRPTVTEESGPGEGPEA